MDQLFVDNLSGTEDDSSYSELLPSKIFKQTKKKNNKKIMESGFG